MKRLLAILGIVILSSLSAEEDLVEKKEEEVLVEKGKVRGVLVEGKIGYFWFSSKTLRQIFSNGGVNYQISLAAPVYKTWNLYASVDYFYRSGSSIGGGQKTSIQIVPLSFGVKYYFVFPEANTEFYLGIGPRYSFVRISNDSSYVDRRTPNSGLGGFATGGVLFKFGHSVIDLFLDYSYTKLRYHTSLTNVTAHNIQVGGLTGGVGYGYRF